MEYRPTKPRKSTLIFQRRRSSKWQFSVLSETGIIRSWLNKEQGIGWFYKKTNTGENVEGWKITIYSDPACTQEVGTITTNEEGRGGYYLDPGIYYAKETGDEYGRFEDEYWMVDESVRKVEILPHQDTEITFTNVQYGKLKILKTMEDGTTAAGWQFRVTDAAGTEVEGSPFTTSEDGTILETLLPGEYTVEEILPEDSLYVCKSENPQKVSVVQGQITEVTFINGIRTGRITVQKVDTQRKSLIGCHVPAGMERGRRSVVAGDVLRNRDQGRLRQCRSRRWDAHQRRRRDSGMDESSSRPAIPPDRSERSEWLQAAARHSFLRGIACGWSDRGAYSGQRQNIHHAGNRFCLRHGSEGTEFTHGFGLPGAVACQKTETII